MGIHQYLVDLDPLFLYTFDPEESYIDDSNGIGIYLNKTENDYPELTCSKRSILDKNADTGSLEYRALSYLEIGSNFKSVNLGIGTKRITYNNIATNGTSSMVNVNLSESSVCATADFTDHYRTIPTNHSIVFQIQFDKSLSHSTIPIYQELTETHIHDARRSFLVSSFNDPYFVFGRVRIYIDDNYILFGNRTTSTNVRYSISSGSILTVVLLVSNNTVSVYINSSFIGSFQSTTTDRSVKIGYDTRSVYNAAASEYYAQPCYNYYTASSSLKIDNFGVYPRLLTTKEIVKISDLNIDYLQRYRNLGYSFLCDFSNWYNTNHQVYAEQSYHLNNLLGGTGALRLDNPSRKGVVVKKVINKDYEYECTLDHQASIIAGRNNDVSGQTYYKPVFTGSGSLTFNFSTTDQNGVLYMSSEFLQYSRNFLLLFVSGTLKLIINNIEVLNISGLANGETHSICISMNTSKTDLYINETLFYTHRGDITLVNGMFTQFGGAMPGVHYMLECTFSMIGFTSIFHTSDTLERLKSSTGLYKADGIVTLNNIAVGTNIFVYNRHTGALLEVIKSSMYDGIFSYVNKNPYTIMILVADNSGAGGSTYIVDPVLIK